MTPPLPPLPESTAHGVPYADASEQQRAQALRYVQKRLHQHFPPLKPATWANAMQQVQPDLRVEPQTAVLDEDDLTYLANYLALSPEVPALDPTIHGPRAGYLAKRLVNYEDDAIQALEEMAANPLAYGPLVYRLVTSLAGGNSVADEVFQATHRGPWGRPGGPGRDVARATVRERLAALRHARGEAEFASFQG
jgi:hypothetical protein